LASEVLLSVVPPIVSLAILLSVMKSAYARLRGQFFKKLDHANSWREHAVLAWRNGVAGGFLGSSFAAFMIAIPYYWAWESYASAAGFYGQVAPLGRVMLEFMYAIIFVACISGFLSLFFSRVRLQRWKLVLSSAPSTLAVLAGAVVGGILSGVIIGPVLMLYFGQMSRPQFTAARRNNVVRNDRILHCERSTGRGLT
jgi:hypothetical protein